MSRKKDSEVWEAYYKKTFRDSPRPLLVNTLKFIEANSSCRKAIDLGCGSGRDSLHLLRCNWQVTAIDGEAKAIEFIQSILEQKYASNINFIQTSFEDILDLPNADLIYSNLSLPFCKKEKFAQFWKAIESACNSGGYFAGQFFGLEDDWILEKGLTGHTEAEIKHMLAGFQILQWQETKEKGPTALDKEKNWHIFSVIARKLTNI